jgi:hypothetical protein
VHLQEELACDTHRFTRLLRAYSGIWSSDTRLKLSASNPSAVRGPIRHTDFCLFLRRDTVLLVPDFDLPTRQFSMSSRYLDGSGAAKMRGSSYVQVSVLRLTQNGSPSPSCSVVHPTGNGWVSPPVATGLGSVIWMVPSLLMYWNRQCTCAPRLTLLGSATT